jgi:hypothetical protein
MAISTINSLLDSAYRVIGINADDRIITGRQKQEAITVLNELLDSYFSEGYLIPYYTEKEFTLVIGQKVYEFSELGSADVTSKKIAHLKYVNLFDNEMRYGVDVGYDTMDWSLTHNTEISGRPFRAYLQNADFASFLYFNRLPDKAYVCRIKAKFALSNVALNTDLTVVPIYYTSFFKFALARELHAIFPSSTWTPQKEKMYGEKLANIKSTSDLDILQKTSGALMRRRFVYLGPNPD